MAIQRVLRALPLAMALPAFAQAQTWNNVADFSPVNNPAGVWSYGWSSSRATCVTDFHLFDTLSHPADPGLVFWSRPAGTPSLGDNTTDHAIPYADNPVCPAHTQLFHPGSGGENGILRWTAPADATVRIDAAFGTVQLDPQGFTTDVAIMHDGVELWSAFIDRTGTSTSMARAVHAGDTLDFTVGYGSNHTYFDDSTSLLVTITALCPSDFNGDGFTDIFDFTDFVTCFEGGTCPAGKSADFNNDGFADVYDFTDFVTAFETGC